MRAGIVASSRVRGAAADFSPLDIAWHTAFWAEDPNWTNPGDGNAVTSWRDASGNDRDATTSSAAPIFRASVAAFNNRSAIDSDSRNLQTEAFTALSQPNTIVIVGAFASSGTQVMFSGIVSGNRHQVWTASGEYRLFAGSTISSASILDGDPHLFVSKFDTSASAMELDGTQVLSGDAGSHTLTGITLFSDHVGGGSSGQLVAFVGLYPGILPAGDMADLEAWAADHYGLTV